jgi:hypothetical protein
LNNVWTLEHFTLYKHKYIYQRLRTILYVHMSLENIHVPLSKVPSGVQQTVSLSGMSFLKMKLYTPFGRKAAWGRKGTLGGTFQ